MERENILGAPAEGFGQDVTFTIRQDPRDIPQARQGVDISRSKIGIRGGHQRVQPVQIDRQAAPAPDPTMAILLKVADPLMRAHIQERRAAAMTQGMTAAAAGMAIQEVADTQPWYSKLFGDSDVVEGARQYTANSKAMQLAGDIEASMPELAKLPPAEAAKVYQSKVQGVMTGDEAADNAILAGAMRVMPNVMHRQVREHVAYTQAAALQAQSDNFQSVAARLQALRGAEVGVQTPEDYAALSTQVVQAALPAAGQNMDEWAKRTTKDVLALADNGNLAAIYAMDDVKLLDRLPGDHQLRLRTAIGQAESRVRAAAPVQLHQRMQDVLVRTQYPPEVGGIRANEVAPLVNAINQDFMRVTGSRSPLLDTAGILRGEGHALEVAMRERVSAMKDASSAAKDPGAKKALAVDAAQASILSGTHDFRITTPEYNQGWLQMGGGLSAGDAIAVGANGKPARPHYVAGLVASTNNPKIPDDPTQKQAVHAAMTTAVNLGDARQAMAGLLHFGKLESLSPGVGRHYAGEYAGPLHAMWRQYGPQLAALANDPAAARTKGALENADAYLRFLTDFQDKLVRPKARIGTPVSAKEDLEVVEKATSGGVVDSPWFLTSTLVAANPWGPGRAVEYDRAPLTAASLKAFQEDVGSLLVQESKSGGDPQALARSLLMSEKNGSNRTVAGHRWVKPAGATELTAYLTSDEHGSGAVPSTFVAMMFGKHIEDLVADPQKARVYQEFGGKVPSFLVAGAGKNGESTIHRFSARDLLDRWASRNQLPDPAAAGIQPSP